MIFLKSLPADKTREPISQTGPHSQWAGFPLKQLTQSMNVICKAGPSEISAKDSESSPQERSSISGPAHNSTTKFSPSTAGSTTTKPSKTNLSGQMSTVTLTTDLTCTLFRQTRPHSKSLSGTISESMLKERKNSTLMPFKPCPKCKSSTGTRNSKSAPTERKIKCTSWSSGPFSEEKAATTTTSETKPSENFPNPARKWLKNITDPFLKYSFQFFTH